MKGKSPLSLGNKEAVMSGLLVLIALPLMLLGGLLLDVATNDDRPEDAAPEGDDDAVGDEPFV